MTTVTDTDADRALKAKHRKVWACGDYPTLAHDLIWSLGPVLVEAGSIRCRAARPRRRGRLRQRGHPGRGARRERRRLRPHPGALRRRAACRQPSAGSRSTGGRPTPRRCRSRDAAFDAVLSCVGVMFAPHHQASRRRAGPRLPSRRDDRAAQLDAAGVHRSAVRDHEAVQPAAARRARSRRRCGATRSTYARCSATASPTVSAERRTVTVTQFPGASDFRDVLRVALRTDDGDVRLQRRRRVPRRGAGRRRSTPWLPGSPRTA